ncbi:MAG: hypothetical protein JXC33_02590 [Deltaproteobacteria bacterium]|nr:hypothetical protein [Deltaproteobacteria bacterium]
MTISALSEYAGSFMSHDGLTIFFRKYQADPERARIVISHGRIFCDTVRADNQNHLVESRRCRKKRGSDEILKASAGFTNYAGRKIAFTRNE